MAQHPTPESFARADIPSADADQLGALVAAQQQRIEDLEQQLAMTASRLENADTAIARRDVLGMAKGLMMGSVGCGADEAFAMLAAQASAEGRKAFDVADELVQRHQRRVTAK